VSYKTLEFECREHVGFLTFNRPDRLNALSTEMVEELRDFFGNLDRHLDARVVVIRGAGRAFCAGFDVSDLSGGMAAIHPELGLPTGVVTYGHMVQRAVNDVVIKMREAPQPLIAAVRGAAVGGGFTLSMACDIRIAAEPRLIGLSRAAEYLYTGRRMDAATAERIGFVSRVVSDEQLDGAATELAHEMLNATPLALRLTKAWRRLLNWKPGASFSAA